MRPRTMFLVVAAVLIAVVTAILFSRVMSRARQPSAPQEQIAALQGAEIAVAAHDVKMGDTLKDGDITYASWPVSAVDSRYIRRNPDPQAPSPFVGSVARHPLFAGQPVTAEAFYRRDKAGVMAGLLNPGMVALSVPVSAVTGAAGFVLPSDHVDVLVSEDIRNASQQMGSTQVSGDLMRFAAEAVLTDIRVLAVDDKLVAAEGASNQPGKTVTLELSPKDAETLLVAAKLGELVLALRSASQDPGAIAVKTYLGDIAVSAALRAAAHAGGRSGPSGTILVNRGGAVTSENIAN